jgi:hypothetical protein
MNERRNQAIGHVLGALYWPWVLPPLFYWQSIAELPQPLIVVLLIASGWGVPICALCFSMIGKHRRLRLISGFAVFSLCYLGGNSQHVFDSYSGQDRGLYTALH